MTLGYNGKSSNRHALLGLAAILAIVLAGGLGFLGRDSTARADMNPFQLNISSATCTDAGVTYHFVAPHIANGSGGTLTVAYTLNGGTSTTATVSEIGGNSANAQWNLALTGSGTFHVTSASFEGSDDEAHGLTGGLDLATITCTQESATATLHVIKVVDNNNNPAFTATPSAFSIHVTGSDTDVAGSPQAGMAAPGTSYTLDAGSYTVSETGGPAGYVASYSADCAGGSVTLAAGDSKTCTITNTAPQATTGTETGTATVTVMKYIDGQAATTGSFDFTTHTTASNISGCESGCTFPLTLDSENGWSATTSAMALGASYSVAETGTPSTCGPDDTYRLAGYTTGSTLAAALEGTPGSTIPSFTDIQGDQYVVVWNATCATNTDTGSITIVKQWQDQNGNVITSGLPSGASFTVSGAGVSGFTLNGDNAWQTAFNNLADGNYSFTEGAITGYTETAATCTGATNSTSSFSGGVLNVTLAAGESLTCTVTNKANASANTGSITIVKQWQDQNGNVITSGLPSGASFTVSGSGVSDFTLNSGNNWQMAFSGLGAGDFSFAEGSVTGFTPTGASCTGGTSASTNSFSNGTLSVSLAAGESLTCTVTNRAVSTQTATGSVTIVKHWVDQNGNAVTTGLPGALSFVGAGTDVPSSFTLGTGGVWSTTFSSLEAGAFSFNEIPVTGWTLSSAECLDSANASVPFTLNTATNMFELNLAAGAAVTCTFTNQASSTTAQTGSVTVMKRWLDTTGAVMTAGMPASVTITATGTGIPASFVLGANGVWSQMFTGLAAGNFTFAETPASGWTLVSFSCTDTSNGAPLLASNTSGVFSISLGAMQNASCVFTNQMTTTIAPITIIPTPVVTNPVLVVVPSNPSNVTNVPTGIPPSTTYTAPSTVTLPSTNAAPAANAVAGVSAPNVGAPNTGSGSASDSVPNYAIVLGIIGMTIGAVVFGFSRRLRS